MKTSLALIMPILLPATAFIGPPPPEKIEPELLLPLHTLHGSTATVGQVLNMALTNHPLTSRILHWYTSPDKNGIHADGICAAERSCIARELKKNDKRMWNGWSQLDGREQLLLTIAASLDDWSRMTLAPFFAKFVYSDAVDLVEAVWYIVGHNDASGVVQELRDGKIERAKMHKRWKEAILKARGGCERCYINAAVQGRKVVQKKGLQKYKDDEP